MFSANPCKSLYLVWSWLLLDARLDTASIDPRANAEIEVDQQNDQRCPIDEIPRVRDVVRHAYPEFRNLFRNVVQAEERNHEFADRDEPLKGRAVPEDHQIPGFQQENPHVEIPDSDWGYFEEQADGGIQLHIRIPRVEIDDDRTRWLAQPIIVLQVFD